MVAVCFLHFCLSRCQSRIWSVCFMNIFLMKFCNTGCFSWEMFVFSSNLRWPQTMTKIHFQIVHELVLGLHSCWCGKSPQSQPSSVWSILAVMTQIFLFFSDFYKHSCHISGFPALHSSVRLFASLLLIEQHAFFVFTPSEWRSKRGENEDLFTGVSS